MPSNDKPPEHDKQVGGREPGKESAQEPESTPVKGTDTDDAEFISSSFLVVEESGKSGKSAPPLPLESSEIEIGEPPPPPPGPDTRTSRLGEPVPATVPKAKPAGRQARTAGEAILPTLDVIAPEGERAKPTKESARSIRETVKSTRTAARPVPQLIKPARSPVDQPDRTAPSRLAESWPAQAQDLVSRIQTELATNPKPQRAARLHYELARLSEAAPADPQRALKHYLKAYEIAPDHLPTIRGARRTLLGLKEFRRALPFFDAEMKNTADAGRKAALLFAKGRLLEDQIGSRKDAREAYAAALELDADDLSILRALEQSELSERSWEDLTRTHARLADAVSADPRHCAAITARRAQVTETRLGNLDVAAQLYETALQLDQKAPGVLGGLKRIYGTQRRWRDLVRILELESRLTGNPEVRAMALMRAGTLSDKQLGNRTGAIDALKQAVELLPGNTEVLEELARLLERAERYQELQPILERLLSLRQDPRERLDLSHRLGRLSEEQIKDDQAAERWYRAALENDPTYVPALQALEKLYQRRDAWQELIAICLAEAQGSPKSPERQATAHHRIAQVFEDKVGDIEQAIHHHARALSFAPGFEAPFKALTRLYAQLGRHRDLVDLYQRAADQAGQIEQAIAYLFKIGSLYEDFLDEPVQAAHVYQSILAKDPNRLGAIHALQRAWDRAGRHRELVDAIEQELDRTRDNDLVASLLHRAGVVLLDNLVDRERALVKFRRALEIRPNHLPSLKNLGRIYYYLGRWEDLLEIYRRELEMLMDDSQRAGLLQKMGELCEVRLGKPFQAVEHYRQAVDIDPLYRPALGALRRLLEQQERWDELNELLEKEAEGLPDPAARATVLYHIGLIAEERLNSPVKAIAAYERALQQNGTYRPVIDALKRLYAEARNWRKLAEVLTQESSVSKEPVLVLDALAREGQISRDELGDPHRAIACFEAILEREPEQVGALLALEEIYREVKKTERLQQVIATQSEHLRDPRARVATLREQARIQATTEQPDHKALQATYDTILGLAPGDLITLTALENRALLESDRALLAQVDAQLASATSEPDLQGAFWTRLAESQEMSDDTSALRTYRAAIAADPQNLAAARGFSRTADRLEDLEALAEAAGYEADIVRDKEFAARLLVRASVLGMEKVGNRGAAVRYLDRALELWPDHQEAADRLVALLVEPDETNRLVDLLLRTAQSGRTDERRVALWLQVATIQEERQNDLNGAIRSLHKLLHLTPDNLQVLKRLADLCCRDGQWLEAARMLERVLEQEPSSSAKQEIQLFLAQIYDQRLDDPRRATSLVKAVLDGDPTNRVALLRTLELQARTGQVEKAALSTRKLLKTAQAPTERAALLLRLGRFEHQLGRRVAAAEAFEEAVSLEGARGEAGEEYRRLVEDVGSWTRYAGALERYLQRLESEGRPDLQDYLDLSRTQADHLGDPTLALTTLQRALSIGGASVPLQAEIARRLVDAHRFEEALAELQGLLDSDVGQPEIWRALSLAYQELGREIEGTMALEPIVVLGAADPQEQERIRSRVSRPGQARAGSLSESMLAALSEEDARTASAASLVKTLLEALPRMVSVDVESYAVTTSDRVTETSSLPLARVVEQLKAVFDFKEFETYLHRHHQRGVGIELSYPPTLLIPHDITGLTRAQQVFLLAQPMAYLARGLQPLWKLSAREVETVMAAAARMVDSRYRSAVVGEQKLDELSKRLSKTLSRRSRRSVEEAAQRFASQPKIQIDQWMAQVERTASRAALLLADDLVDAIAFLRENEPALASLQGPDLVKQSSRVADLMRFWLSDKALATRLKMGLV